MYQYGTIRRLPPHQHQQHPPLRMRSSSQRQHRSSLFLVLTMMTIQWFQLPPQYTTTSAFFLFRLGNSCRSIQRFQRCGLLNLSVLMHVGEANTDACTERCVFFPNIQTKTNQMMNCGSCTIITNNNTTQPGYNIYIDLVNITGIGNGTYFAQARDRWQQVITSDLTDINISALNYRPSSPHCQLPSSNIIDDIYICAMYTKIDGRGTILGSAGPLELRRYSALPIIGEMKFDYDDIYRLQLKDNFQNVILHEMGHILGIGTLWTLTDVTGPRSSNCPYLGTAATSEFRKISNCTTTKVPTETSYDRNGGTFCTHWDEECMGSELMTGLLENNNQSYHPLSRITIAGLFDLGYAVDYTTADTYTIDHLNANCKCLTKPSTRQRRNIRQPSSRYRKRLRSTPNIDSGVHQFGFMDDSSPSSGGKSPRRQRRRISDEAYEMAMSYGLNILSERRNDQQIQNQFLTSVSNDGDTITTTSATRYVGDQIISILVEDAGEIYGVMVVHDDDDE